MERKQAFKRPWENDECFFSVPDTNIIKVLEHRQGEKLAKDFIKKLKTKMVVPSNNVETHNGNWILYLS